MIAMGITSGPVLYWLPGKIEPRTNPIREQVPKAAQHLHHLFGKLLAVQTRVALLSARVAATALERTVWIFRTVCHGVREASL